MEVLYEHKEYSTDTLKAKEVKNLINSTYKVLSSALDDGITTQIPPAMRYRLENSVFIFSGFKTMHELREASALMRDSEGNVKSFDKFTQDILSIHDKYNVNYLRAEYDFAVSSSQMAARWEALGDDDDTILQYRTAKDDHVRAEHRPLDGITLPKKNGFWDSYYPPNNWGCRCTAVEVLEDDYPMSDADEAEGIGNRALSVRGKKSELFRFNPGKEKKVFPPKHPYFCRQMGSCNKVSLASNKSPFCRDCFILQDVRKEQVRQGLKRVDNEVKEWANNRLGGDKIEKITSKALHENHLILNRVSVKNYLGHAKSKEAKELLYNIDELVNALRYKDSAGVGKGKNMKSPKDKANVEAKMRRGVTSYNYYTAKINGVDWRFDMEVIRNKYEQLYSVNMAKK